MTQPARRWKSSLQTDRYINTSMCHNRSTMKSWPALLLEKPSTPSLDRITALQNSDDSGIRQKVSPDRARSGPGQDCPRRSKYFLGWSTVSPHRNMNSLATRNRKLCSSAERFEQLDVAASVTGENANAHSTAVRSIAVPHPDAKKILGRVAQFQKVLLVFSYPTNMTRLRNVLAV